MTQLRTVRCTDDPGLSRQDQCGHKGAWFSGKEGGGRVGIRCDDTSRVRVT